MDDNFIQVDLYGWRPPAMTTIVTGSSGLLGRHVVAALTEAGHEVVGIDIAPPPAGATRQVCADLADMASALQLVRDARAVVHAAAIPRPTGRTARDVFSINVGITFNVVEAAVLSGVPRLVYASSYSVLGFPFNINPVSPRYFPIDSAHPVAPQDAYALSKWLGEEVIAAAVRRSGIAAVSLRMPWIQTAESFAREVIPLRIDDAAAARNLWSYLDARDAGAAFVAAVEARAEGHHRLFVSAADTFMEDDTERLARTAYPAAELSRAMTGAECVFDLAEARNVLGFEPRHTWRSYGKA
jgi:nucleoside-diphosphate-sugar epimerase